MQASEAEFQAWEKLIADGVPRFNASRMAGTTLRRLANADQVRFDDGVKLSLERQAARAESVLADELAKENPPPQLVALELKAHHPDYEDKTKLELTGKVEHEHRGEFTLAALVKRARELGVLEQLGLDRSQDDVPAARSLPAGPAGAAE